MTEKQTHYNFVSEEPIDADIQKYFMEKFQELLRMLDEASEISVDIPYNLLANVICHQICNYTEEERNEELEYFINLVKKFLSLNCRKNYEK